MGVLGPAESVRAGRELDDVANFGREGQREDQERIGVDPTAS